MSLRQTEPVMEKVGGRKYYITPFPAFKAANISGELVSVLAPVVGALLPIVALEEAGKREAGSDMDDAVEAISKCSEIDGDRLERLMKKLLLGGNVSVEVEDDDGSIEGQRLDEDLANELFCGEMQDMFELCLHVIRVNYGGFFKKLGSQSGKEGQAAEKAPRKRL